MILNIFFLQYVSVVIRAWPEQGVSLCPQVSDSLQPPEQEAASLLEAERLLLLQRRLLPAPHALLVPRLPPQHKHALAL